MPLTRLFHSRWAWGWRVRWALWLNRPQQALAELDALLQRWPHDAWALSCRAVQHQQAGQLTAARADLSALVSAHPQRHAADWFNLGYVLDRLDQPAEAAGAFEQALALAPGLDVAWYGLGLVRLRLGQLAQAQAALTRCTELQPMSPHAWYQLARLHAEQGNAAAAQQLIDHLQGFEPGVAQRLMQETGLRPTTAGWT